MTGRFSMLAGALLVALALSSTAQAQPMVISGAPEQNASYPAYIHTRLKPSGESINNTKARGTVELWLNGDMYAGTIKLKEIVNFTLAHIHVGDNTTSGPVLTWAFPLSASGVGAVPHLSGVFRFPFSFASSTLNASTLANEGYYINIHTVKYPNGEIRGQLMGSNGTSSMKRRMH